MVEQRKLNTKRQQTPRLDMALITRITQDKNANWWAGGNVELRGTRGLRAAVGELNRSPSEEYEFCKQLYGMGGRPRGL